MKTNASHLATLAAAAMFLGGVAMAQSQGEHHMDSEGALGVAKGPAAAQIKAEITRRNLTCSDMTGEAKPCRLVDNALNADVHYGVVPESGEQVAFVSVRWQSDTSGNAVDAKGMVFVAPPGGNFRFVGSADIVGHSVSDVRFEPNRVTYETRYLRPKDSRADPTGRRRYEVTYGSGPLKVGIQRTGHVPKGKEVGIPTSTVPGMRTHGDAAPRR